MFDEIRFSKIERLPNYVFAEVNAIKMAARRAGEDIIDFSMGNPDGRTPQHIIDKLCESAQKDKTHGYSVSQGIYKLRLACANWYKRKYGVILDPESEIVAVMGSKEGFVHLTSAIVNPGDVAVVPDPAYPIHTQAFIIAGGNVVKIPLAYDENLNFNEDKFFIDLQKTFDESIPRPKYVVVNFPHNPTTVVVQKSFYERLVAMARQERFYIISDIAYAEIAFDDYKTPSIFEVQGAKDVAVEAYTLSKTTRTYPSINYGRTFPYKFDRRHILNCQLQYAFVRRVTRKGTAEHNVACNAVFASGNRLTLPIGTYQGFAPPHWDNLKTGFIHPDEYYRHIYDRQQMSDVNAISIKNYFRTALAYNYISKKRKYTRELSVSVFNIFNRRNPYAIFHEEDRWKQLSIVPIMPMVRWSVSW